MCFWTSVAPRQLNSSCIFLLGPYTKLQQHHKKHCLYCPILFSTLEDFNAIIRVFFRHLIWFFRRRPQGTWVALQQVLVQHAILCFPRSILLEVFTPAPQYLNIHCSSEELMHLRMLGGAQYIFLFYFYFCLIRYIRITLIFRQYPKLSDAHQVTEWLPSSDLVLMRNCYG